MDRRSLERSEKHSKCRLRDVRLCRKMKDDELRQQEIKSEILMIKALMKCASMKGVALKRQLKASDECPRDESANLEVLTCNEVKRCEKAQDAITKHKAHLNSLLRIKK